jgi:hypothetical protein
MKEITFFIPDLNGGGAERSLLNLLSCWPPDLRGLLRPALVVRRLEGPYVGDVPKWIEVKSLQLPRSGSKSSVQTVTRLARILRKRRPVAVVAFLSYPSVVFAARLARIQCKVIISVQNPPLSVDSDPKTPSILHSWL